MSKSAGLQAAQLSFQLSPIILTGGIAPLALGGMLPIIAITEAVNFTAGLLSGGQIDLDNAFAHFSVMPGGSLIANSYGTYPFANQSVAANAVIGEPLRVSLKMTCPARSGGGGFAAKLPVLTALQALLELHSNTGGTYTVATPSYLYTNCLLKDLRHIGDTSPSQPQSIWQWDFDQPLLTEQQAVIAYNGMMQNIVGGTPSTGALSGGEVIGQPLSLAAPSTISSASSLGGTSAAAYTPPI